MTLHEYHRECKWILLFVQIYIQFALIWFNEVETADYGLSSGPGLRQMLLHCTRTHRVLV